MILGRESVPKFIMGIVVYLYDRVYVYTIYV